MRDETIVDRSPRCLGGDTFADRLLFLKWQDWTSHYTLVLALDSGKGSRDLRCTSFRMF